MCFFSYSFFWNIAHHHQGKFNAKAKKSLDGVRKADVNYNAKLL
jgi:hypothetical protein